MKAQDLSDDVVDALNESVDISDWISQHHPASVIQTRNSMLAAPSYGISLAHREAILLLMRHDCRTSAYALLRPLYEAFIRGLWAEECDDDALAQLVKTKELPKFDTVIKQLDEGTAPVFAGSKAKVWKAMSHYAHGGLRQLERWASAYEIGPRHPDGEVVQLLRYVDLYGLLALCGIARLAGIPTDLHEAKVMSYIEQSSPDASSSPVK